MGTFSMWHWLVVLAVILIIFGAGKLPTVMGDVAKGFKNFKAGMKDEADEKAQISAKDESKPACGSGGSRATRLHARCRRDRGGVRPAYEGGRG